MTRICSETSSKIALASLLSSVAVFGSSFGSDVRAVCELYRVDYMALSLPHPKECDGMFPSTRSII